MFSLVSFLLVACSANQEVEPLLDNKGTEKYEQFTQSSESKEVLERITPEGELADKEKYTAIDSIEEKTHIVVNNNVPYFNNEDITSTDSYASYGELDDMGRVTAANALLGVELMPSEERGDISNIEPTGWKQRRYTNVCGGWLYNRSHLIGHQLTGEDDNPNNLITGTRFFNVEGMLPFENTVANYIETTENHVRYRITPVFEGDNLLASGIYMEAFSIEDNGEGVMFNVYIPNIQPNVELNYVDGSSIGPEGPVEEKDAEDIIPYNSGENSTPNSSDTSSTDVQYIDENGNGLIKGSNSGIYHLPSGTHYDKTKNIKQWFKSIEEAEEAGYRASKN